MAAALEKVRVEFKGRVDLLRVNADQAPEVLSKLGIKGIPAMVGYSNGRQVFKHTGLQSEQALRSQFLAMEQGIPPVVGIAPFIRLLRVAAGLTLVIVGWYNGPSYLVAGIGGLVVFWGVYERCPVYRAVAQKVHDLTKRKPCQGARSEE